MAYARYSRRTTARAPARGYARRPATNRTAARRRSGGYTGRRSAAPEVRIVLEAPGLRMPANAVRMPAKRKPF